MTNAEMHRRLATMTEKQINLVEWYVMKGYGAHNIKFDTGLKLSQINAVFKLFDEKLDEGVQAYKDICAGNY